MSTGVTSSDITSVVAPIPRRGRSVTVSRRPLIIASAVALIIAGAAFAAPAAGGDTANSAESAVSANPDELAIDYVRQHAASLGVSPEDVSDVFVLSSYKSQHTGVTHVTSTSDTRAWRCSADTPPSTSTPTAASSTSAAAS
jgi:hypothetical protein